ncbi:hypothetical protein HUG15_01410 [Salicibibacter cibarius]|uniref:Uncharacterized protein n=2 Tax=Salicibibacter cibarius TaxID=2743000 RepID=A0A7T6Z6Y9_9BACI|nr:hypothetical protein HUG15_01410 [Salicibibacter cibarius]
MQFCLEKYGVNRGIYNTIDEWFYDQGIEDIIERRKEILRFLEFVENQYEKKNEKRKFGKGGLKISLQDYYFPSYKGVTSKVV